MALTADVLASLKCSDRDTEGILKAIRAPLLLQSPLQALLETLLTRLTSQSKVIIKLSEQVDKLSVESALGERLQFLESRINDALGPPGEEPKLSPFKQQAILDKLEHLEDVVANHTDEISAIGDTQETEIKPQLSTITTTLQGVENLAGRLVAQDVMAEEMGIPIPDLQQTCSQPPADVAVRIDSARRLAREESMRSSTLAALSTRIDRVEESVDEQAELTTKMEALSEAVSSLSSQHAAAALDADERLRSLEQDNAALRALVDDEVQRVQGMVEKQASDVDLGKLQSNLHALRRSLDEQDVFVKHLQRKDIHRLDGMVLELGKSVECALGMRDADLQFAEALKLLERDVEMMKKKLSNGLAAAMGADLTSLGATARQSDLVEMAAALELRPDRAEVGKMIRKAVSNALSAAQELSEAGDARGDGPSGAGRALKFRCLSCDRDVEPSRPKPVGKLPSPQGLLPSVERFPSTRPTTPVLGPAGPGLNAATLRQQHVDAHASKGGESNDAGGRASPRSRPSTAKERRDPAPDVKRPVSAKTVSHESRTPVFSQ